MNQKEKCELLKSSIEHLYSKEGRTKSYISRLLEIDRKTLVGKINEWGLKEAPPMRHAKPSTLKFIASRKERLLSLLQTTKPITVITKECDCPRDVFYKTVLVMDDDIREAYEVYLRRCKQDTKERKEKMLDASSFNYNYEKIEGEEWRPILGYEGYEVSNYGRIRRYAKEYNRAYLLAKQECGTDNRFYVTLYGKEKKKNLLVSRITASTFCDGRTAERCAVNHKDGNPQNNRADNLEWVTYSENLKHSYDVLHRPKNRVNKINYTILYKDKYQFKTVAAFARFIGKSETQTRRYIDNPEKHDIKIIPKQ